MALLPSQKHQATGKTSFLIFYYIVAQHLPSENACERGSKSQGSLSRCNLRECSHQPLAFFSHQSDRLQAAESLSMGVQSLAIVYSLPYAFLMWAVVAFITAVFLFAFQAWLNLTSSFLIWVMTLGVYEMDPKLALIMNIRPWWITYLDHFILFGRRTQHPCHAAVALGTAQRADGHWKSACSQPWVASTDTPVVRDWERFAAARTKKTGPRT